MHTVAFERPDGKDLKLEMIHVQGSSLQPNNTEGRHRHAFNTIFFIRKGVSRQEVDFDEYTLSENQVLCIPQGAIHWEQASQLEDGFILLFTDDFFSGPQRVLLKGFMQYAMNARKMCIQLDEEQAKLIHTYCSLINIEQQGGDNQNQTFLLQNLMLALLNKLESFIQHVNTPNSFIKQRHLFQQFMALVDEHYIKQKSVPFYTESLQVSSRNLNTVLKEMLGSTAQDIILDKVVLEAKRALSFSDLSVKEVAFELGFSSQYYFSRVFKKKTGLSPEEFRRQFAQ